MGSDWSFEDLRGGRRIVRDVGRRPIFDILSRGSERFVGLVLAPSLAELIHLEEILLASDHRYVVILVANILAPMLMITIE
jgi:hypothetical protein